MFINRDKAYHSCSAERYTLRLQCTSVEAFGTPDPINNCSEIGSYVPNLSHFVEPDFAEK